MGLVVRLYFWLDRRRVGFVCCEEDVLVVAFSLCLFGGPGGVGVPEFFTAGVVVPGDDVCLFVCGAGGVVLVAGAGAFACAAVPVAARLALGAVHGAALPAAGRVLCGGVCDDGGGAGSVAGVDGGCSAGVAGVHAIFGGGRVAEVGFCACYG